MPRFLSAAEEYFYAGAQTETCSTKRIHPLTQSASILSHAHTQNTTTTTTTTTTTSPPQRAHANTRAHTNTHQHRGGGPRKIRLAPVFRWFPLLLYVFGAGATQRL